VRRDRLAAALDRANQATLKQLREMTRSSQDKPAARTHISVHMRGQITLIPVQDIIYFLADNKYVTVRTTGESHLIEDSLVSLEDEFGGGFLRIHRNALVATAFIRGIEKQSSGRWQVLLQGVDEKLDVSRRHTPAVRRWTRQQ
jgi:two-component system response regulator AlgR